jgi:uncharacterized protein
VGAPVIHPATRVVRVSSEVGDGVMATAFIPRGTIVWTQDSLDRVFEPDVVELLGKQYRSLLDHYAHIDEQGRYVLCWDAGKLINHSCDPTLRGVGTWFQVARRDIAPGDEITCDYAECNVTEALSCLCKAPSCRGEVHGRDLLRFFPEWDKEAQELLPLLKTVEQPLWPFLLDQREVDDYLSRGALPSFSSLYAGAT